jgi:hypothetical protein
MKMEKSKIYDFRKSLKIFFASYFLFVNHIKIEPTGLKKKSLRRQEPNPTLCWRIFSR